MRVDIRRFAQTELITRFNMGLDGNSTVFYTDSNGLQVDRILLHDDGKGLGPGDDSILNDVLPVEIGFTIIFERVDESRTLPEHFAYNTLSAHLALQSLLYKPIVLTSKGNPPLIPSSSLKSFPCDLQLVTCRPITPHLNQRLLILHRPGIDCSGNGGGR
uniref:Uncharacterized protein n=1 Tax=Parascaris equorum TaxID=6256 RepID=A0A914RYC3_PAREQ